MEAINVYREAVKRTFADVYQVLPETIDVSWGNDTITVRCSDHTFNSAPRAKAAGGGLPSYSDLLTCLQIAEDARKFNNPDYLSISK
jgi:hypothetical protein